MPPPPPPVDAGGLSRGGGVVPRRRPGPFWRAVAAVVLLGSALAAVSGSAPVGAQTTCNVADATTTATNTYNHHRESGNTETATALYRVLISLGATLPAWSGSQISGDAPTTPITESQFRAVLTARGDTWSGWTPIFTALSCLEAAPSPVVRISGGAAVTEGEDAMFRLTAFPPPSPSLTVNVTVADSADFVAGGDEGTDTVIIGTSGTATYTVSTVDDTAVEADGSVKVTVETGNGYTPGSTSSATVTINDNDDVGIAEPAGHKQPALTAVVANEGANSRIMLRVPDGLGNRVRHFTFAFRDTVTKLGYAPPGASATATGWYDCDAGDLVNARLYTTKGEQKVWNGSSYDTVTSYSVVGTEMVTYETDKRSGEVVDVSVELCPGSEGKTFGLQWYLDVSYPFHESFAHDAPNCWDSSESFPRHEETLNGTDYVIPAYTVHKSFLCWTTVTIVGQGQGQGGQPAVEEGDSQPAQEEGQPAQQDSQPAQEEPEPEPAGPDCVSAELLADVEGYAAETWRESVDHVSRWSRALAAFGQANSYSNNPMTASEAQTYADRGLVRWPPVTAALQCLETAAAQQAESESQPSQNPAPTPTPTPPQDSQPAQEEPELEPAGPVCVSAELLADVEGYAAETWRESVDHVSRWSRVLAAFGQANSYSNNPMTASEAQTYADRGLVRWPPVTAALQCLETAAAQ